MHLVHLIIMTEMLTSAFKEDTLAGSVEAYMKFTVISMFRNYFKPQYRATVMPCPKS